MRRTMAVLILCMLGAMACGGDDAPAATTQAGRPVGTVSEGFEIASGTGEQTVDIKGLKFGGDVTVKVGQSVRWSNSDDFPHTSTGDNKEWDSTTIAPRGAFAVKFNKAGTYAYHCEVHRQMKATVTVE